METTMNIGLLFWIVWVICALAWAGVSFVGMGGQYGHLVGGGAVDLILSGLLGWQVFGPVVRK
jgi:hypothetical protein